MQRRVRFAVQNLPPPPAGAVPLPPGGPPPPAVPPVYLTQDQVVTDPNIPEEETIRQVLHWIGFLTDAQKDSLVNDGFESFGDAATMTEKDINAMATSFASRTANNGRMFFGTRRIKFLKAFTHWIRDFYRVSGVPEIVGLSAVTFKAQLDRAAARAIVRKNMESQTKTSAEAASPGPLENEKQWKHWEEKFVNYAKAHIGADGVPLSYVI